jgi:hypothetical protein
VRVGGLTYFDSETAQPPLAASTIQAIIRAFDRAAPTDPYTGEPLVCDTSTGLYAFLGSDSAAHALARRVWNLCERDRRWRGGQPSTESPE